MTALSRPSLPRNGVLPRLQRRVREDAAPTPAPTAAPAEADAPPSLRDALTARRLVVLGLILAVTGVSVALLLPALADLPAMWRRVTEGSLGWLALALGLEVLSFAGHIVLFRAVCVDGGSRIGMRDSTTITLAGHAATRLFASAGAGGVALTAWAMRRSGMTRQDVASRMVTFLVLLYSVYMVTLVVGGLGLWSGVLPGEGSLAITLGPAAFGAFVIAAVLALPRLHGPLERRAPRSRIAAKLTGVSAALGDGIANAVRMVRRGNLALVGALMWWGFDIAVLWACFHAFGAAPSFAVVAVAYFVGMLANTLPLPGGIGGVDGGMIGALIAFGVDPASAVLAVLAYRLFAFWLPIVPGALAYVGLRRTVSRWQADDEQQAAAVPERAPAPAPAPQLAAA